MEKFITSQIVTNFESVNEIAIALGLIDLPFSEGSHGFKAN